MHLVLAGNIGVGKTSLAEAFAAARGAVLVPEPAAANPYLAEFYADMPRWAFHSQVFFLAHRLRQHAELAAEVSAKKLVVQDRSLYEDAEIFAQNLADQGSLVARDHATYRELYKASTSVIRAPDKIVYLRASLATLKARIAQRGRTYEAAIPDAYLLRLNTMYDAWARRFALAPVVTIETDDLDRDAVASRLAALVTAPA